MENKPINEIFDSYPYSPFSQWSRDELQKAYEELLLECDILKAKLDGDNDFLNTFYPSMHTVAAEIESSYSQMTR